MVQKVWNLNMFFLQAAMPQFGKRNEDPIAVINFPIPCFLHNPTNTDEEELRRLFYVALTRAEQHLIISYCRFKNDGKELEPSMFIAEILDEQQLQVEKMFIDESVIAEFNAIQFGETGDPAN